MSRYLDSIPHPWSRENIEAAMSANFMDVRSSIDETDGGKLWRALNDLHDTLWIFEASATELLDEICVFGGRSRNGNFWHPTNADEVEGHTRAVKRKIFNCTSSLMALVEHCRNFERSFPVRGYSGRLKDSFSTPGLHSFLQCFRNYNTHWRVAETNWMISRDFQTGSSETSFIVTKSELLRWGGWSSKAIEYIAGSPSKVDIYKVFFQYRQMVQKFYSWHRGAVLDQYAASYQPYLEYKRLHEGLRMKMYWNMAISRASEAVNPYEHLSRHLSKRQLEKILSLDHRSSDQVDALIRILGMEQFCDEALRQRVLSLFNKG